MTNKEFLKYLALARCPEDVIRADDVNWKEWNDRCDKLSKEYGNFIACFACWDMFLENFKPGATK